MEANDVTVTINIHTFIHVFMDNYFYVLYLLIRVVSGTEEKIAPLSFFHGCRKRRLKD
jgi:hypothetical protein